MTHSTLTDANLTGATLSNTDISISDIKTVNLEGTSLSEANFKTGTYDNGRWNFQWKQNINHKLKIGFLPLVILSLTLALLFYYYPIGTGLSLGGVSWFLFLSKGRQLETVTGHNGYLISYVFTVFGVMLLIIAMIFDPTGELYNYISGLLPFLGGKTNIESTESLGVILLVVLASFSYFCHIAFSTYWRIFEEMLKYFNH